MSWFMKMLGVDPVRVATGVADVVDRFVETEEEKKAAAILLMKIQQEPDKWQAEINKIEANHRSVFIAGWRPFIGWVGGVGLAFHFIVSPLFEWVVVIIGSKVTAPQLNTEGLISIVLALLGLAATRTYEKMNGLTK